MDKNTIHKVIYVYAELPSESQVLPGEYLKKKQEKNLEILKKSVSMIEDTETFVKEVKKVMQKNKKRYEKAFSEPIDEDFINILLYDLFKKKLIDKEKFEKLKKDLSKHIEIYV